MDIWIWGTGQTAIDILKNGLSRAISGFIETKKTKETFWDYPVISAEEIPESFDYILIANQFADQIYDWCMDARLDLQKIIFLVKGKKTDYVKPSEMLKNVLGERNYTNYQTQYEVYTDSFIEKDKRIYQQLNRRKNFEIQEKYMWPVIGEKYAPNGMMGNYFWQDLWAARKIIKSGVKEHWDIGSRVDGFIAHLLASDIKVNVIDIRPFPAQVDNLITIVDDATMLNQFEEDSVASMSALCSLEHFGLGRYGDAIDPEACFKCFENIQRKLKSGGNLYLSVPIGRERVEFNAHRVFYASTIADCFADLRLAEFSCAAGGAIEYHVDIHKYDNDPHNGEYRYGLFYFVKK